MASAAGKLRRRAAGCDRAYASSLRASAPHDEDRGSDSESSAGIAGGSFDSPRSQVEHSDDGADGEIARRLAAGDRDAMSELIQRHGDMLRRLVGRLCAWSADCDDIMQEVLLRAWERSATFRGGSLAAWLRQLAINQCRSRFRKLGIARRLFDRIRQRTSVTTDRSVSSDVESIELTRYALARLAPADRMLVVLYHLEEMPLEAIGEHLRIRPATLAVRLHRARARMKQCLTTEIDGQCGDKRDVGDKGDENDS